MCFDLHQQMTGSNSDMFGVKEGGSKESVGGRKEGR